MHLSKILPASCLCSLFAVSIQADSLPSFVFTALTTTAGDSASDIAVLDVDGDGFLDVISAASGQQGGDAEITVKLGDGTGAFPDEETLGVTYLKGFDVGDFDEDGMLDLVECGGSFYGGTLSFQFLKGLGKGRFGYGAIQTLTGQPADIMEDVATGDFNGDGHLDVFLVACYSASVWLGAGDGTFSAAPAFPYAYGQRTAAAFDFDADGHLDVAAGGKIYLGLGDGSFAATPSGSGGYYGCLADLDRDGLMDIIGVDFSGYGVALNNGDGSFTSVLGQGFPAGTVLTDAAIGEFNGDQVPDLVLSDETTAGLFVQPGLGAGLFGATVTLGVSNDAGPVATGDFNADGLDDIVVLTSFADQAPDLYTFTNTTTPSDWTGKAGHSGLPFYGSPTLVGCGAITSGAAITLELSNTYSGVLNWFLVVGGSELALPLFAGILVPTPDTIVALTTDSGGAATVPVTWPTGLPSGTQFYFQAWVINTLGPLSVTSSSAVVGTQR